MGPKKIYLIKKEVIDISIIAGFFNEKLIETSGVLVKCKEI